MRNFKKFLALVLAMLMVSACAVSVSAFDDVAAGDKYATAIEMLADLGVISGRGDGKFYPEDTLTREEAAVIAAKVLVGAQAIEWNEATTRFTDVIDAWSFAYINYVDDEGVMVGQGDGTFAPKRALRIDEALKIAVCIADPAAARRADLEYAKNPSLGWAAYYINEADTLGLTAGVTLRKYDVACSRAMFAQFIYNAFDFVEAGSAEEGDKFGLQENFGYDFAEGEVSYNADAAIVTVDGQQIAGALFNEALKEAGYTETAADLDALNSKVYISWMKNGKNIVILALDVLTTGKVVKYNSTDIKVENVYDCLDNDGKYDDLNKKYIKINGVKYEVGATDGVAENETVLGGADTVTVGITVTIDTVPVAKYDTTNDETKAATGLNTLPKYFEAFLYDDNGDGDYERCDIVEYVIATIAKDAATAANGYKQDLYTVNFKNGMDSRPVNVHTGDSAKAAKFSGEEFVADNERPVLVAKTWNTGATVDILENSAEVIGQLTSIIPGTPYSVVIGENTYKFNAFAFNVPESTSLKQTITVYTINGELVNVTAASFVEKVIVVDKATINAAGNVVLTGFDGTKFTDAEYELTGAYKGGKYVAAVGHYENDDEAHKDLVKPVALGGTKTNNVWSGEFVTFEEGVFYKLIVTKDGIYYVEDETVEAKHIDTYFTLPVATAQQFSVDSKYVNIDSVATLHNNSARIITKVVDSTKEANAYYVTYTVASTYADSTGVTATTNDKTGDKVSLIYVTVKGTPVDVTNTVETLAEGQTIVQILGEYVAAAFDYYTYNAFDLLEGKKVTITSAELLDTAAFYIAEAGVVSDSTPTNWVTEKGMDLEINGLVSKYYAWPTKYTTTNDGAPVFGFGAKTEFGAAQITIYDANDTTGVIEFNTDGSVKTIALADAGLVEGRNTFATAYVVKGQIIIIK